MKSTCSLTKHQSAQLYRKEKIQGQTQEREKLQQKNYYWRWNSFAKCTSFYLTTLAYNQKLVCNVHEKKDPVNGTMKIDGRGKYNNHFSDSENDK